LIWENNHYEEAPLETCGEKKKKSTVQDSQEKRKTVSPGKKKGQKGCQCRRKGHADFFRGRKKKKGRVWQVAMDPKAPKRRKKGEKAMWTSH